MESKNKTNVILLCCILFVVAVFAVVMISSFNSSKEYHEESVEKAEKGFDNFQPNYEQQEKAGRDLREKYGY